MVYKPTKRRGFSLIELVIVVVIIAIIAAIAIPKMSRAASGATDAALSQNLSQMRSALDLYAAEHGGTYPVGSTCGAQLTGYTDATGATNSTKTTQYIYGPYLKAIPTCPVGGSTVKGSAVIVATGTAGSAAGGWFYDTTNYTIVANTGSSASTDKDASGTLYNAY